MNPVLSPLNTTKTSTAPSLLCSPKGYKKTAHKLLKSFTESTNTSLSQLGAISWSHTAAGGRFRATLSGKKRGAIPTKEQKSNWNMFLGYIGPRLPRVDCTDTTSTRLEQLVRSVSPKGQCFKLEGSQELESENSAQRALLYLKLRNDGCSKEKSIIFTRRRKCMFDSTQRKDGPACHRTIALGDNRVLGPNWSGWQLHSPRLLVPRQYQSADMSNDHHEYEVLAMEFERLNRRKQLQVDGMDFEDADSSRERLFRTLRKEWDRRECGKRAKTDHSEVTITIPEEPLQVPEAPVISATVEPEVKPPSHTKTASFPLMPLATSPRSKGFRKSTFRPTASLIEPSRVCKFGKSSLVIRSLVPGKSTDRRRTQTKMQARDHRRVFSFAEEAARATVGLLKDNM